MSPPPATPGTPGSPGNPPVAPAPATLAGARAVVTGGSRGIGRAVAHRLAAGGARVALLARDSASLERTAAELGAGDRPAPLALACDVSSPSAVEHAAKKVGEAIGDPTIVVHCAGTLLDRRLVDCEPEDWAAVLATNLGSALAVCHSFGKRMIDAGNGGKVVTVGSAFARKGVSGFSAYAASKAGIEGLTRALAVEWARHGIQVNCVVPGHVVTDMTTDAFADPDTHATVVRGIPARRAAGPDEIAATIVHLAGPDTGFITGASVLVDGGYTLR